MKNTNRIKSFGPRLGGFSKQGTFMPSSPEKYIGSYPVVWRSSWELKFMQWCDTSDRIIRWASEPLPINYVSPLDNRVHKYYVDFYIVYLDEEGNESPWIIEVKPKSHINKPTAPERMTEKQMSNYIWASKQFIVNQAKFQAAKEFAIGKGVQFGIVTENFLFGGV